jgi:hypothetical protein
MTDTLSVDAAVGLLNDVPEELAPEADPAAEAEAPEAPETEEEEIEALPGAEDDDGAETPAEVEDAEPPEPETAVEAPHYWSADKKAAFAALPADLQQTLKEEWLAGERITSQKLQEAAASKKDAEAKAELLQGLSDRISTAAERAEETFADRWSKFTPEAWVELSHKDPNRYIQLKAQHDAEMSAVQQAKSARDAASQVQHAQWVTEQESTLKTLAPHLADPVKGHAERVAVAEFLRSRGVAEQAIDNVGALEVTLAWEAMQYRKGLTALKPRPAAEKAPVRPAASPSQSPQSNALANAETRFKRTGSVDDAVRLLNLKG